METPLLLLQEYKIDQNGRDYLPVKGLREWWRVFCIESSKLWNIGGPIAIQILCQFAIFTVSTVFFGHIGDVELSAFSIVSSLDMLGFGFMLGMGSALETLSGQAFGAGQVNMLGIYMQRSIVTMTATCFLLLPLYAFASPIFRLLGQQAHISKLAGHYALVLIPEIFSLAVSFPTQKFLQAQSKVTVLAWIAFIALLSQVALCWLFVYVFYWGPIGVLVAFVITNWAIAIAQLAYILGWFGEEDGWGGFSWEAFTDIWGFAKLSLASAVMLCLEMWYVSAITFVAGNLKDAVTAVGSFNICMNINWCEFVVFEGINAAISVRVSNELGSGHPKAAKYSVYVTLIQSLVLGIICAVTVFSTRHQIAVIFTDSIEMQKAVIHLSGLLGITMLLNSIQPVISGVAIGGGWQALVAYINLGCYYVVGLPLGIVLGYIANLGVMGIWGGMIIGVAMQTLFLAFVLYKTDWNYEVEQATERMLKWGGRIGATQISN